MILVKLSTLINLGLLNFFLFLSTGSFYIERVNNLDIIYCLKKVICIHYHFNYNNNNYN